ncbi:KAP family NTPase [Aliifodinibius sp. S!AR15-10]|uniref:KAP family P-loop NTPase fold protein n=1 Tax=Aliifodinibius sp. S!AR15-10 TaxID=2950437 RepID=UPI00285731DD|nr:P-loop NTPase fold protein [Aliifodinibius sp. S!AR15-10]MDR8392245.1 KAP family NTPase [Aliifodinibius sp. S!AR15-10]
MLNSEREEVIYAGDQALKDPDDDKFNRAGFAKRVSKILTNKQDSAPLVIGIYGKWGEGKTSVVNFIKHYLDQNDDIIYLDFNPWRYNDEDELLNSFFKQFSQGISKKLGVKGKEIAKGLLTYSGLILAFAEPITGLSVLSSLGWIDKLKALFSSANNFVSSNDLQPLVDSVQESLENSTTLEKQKENINEELKKTGKKHVVFIDDIDRLDNKEIQLLFRIIKLTADFENVIYVLSFDPEMVAAALDEKYPGDENESGLNFLEKIIQVPLKLPKVRRTDLLNDVLFPGINDLLETYSFNLNNEEERNIADALQGNLERRLSTPRMVKRYLNGLAFALPILKGEANPHDIILVEGLRICYPEAYDFVYRNKGVFISDFKKSVYPSSDEVKKEHEEIREDFFKSRDKDLRILLGNLFPRIGKNNFTNISDDELSEAQRISSSHYFERYFTYSVPNQDIKDQDFQDFLERFSKGDEEGSIKKARMLIEQTDNDVFIRKLEENEEKILNSIDPSFAILLSKLGHYFSKRNAGINFSSPLRRVSKLIRDIIVSISKSNRYELSEKVLEHCSNIVLTAEIGRHLHKQNNDERILTDEEHEKLVKFVSGKIREDAKKNGPFYERENTEQDSVFLFNIWKAGSTGREVSNHIKQKIGNSPDSAIQFLRSFMATVHSSEGYFQHGKFEIDEYNYVKDLIDPKFIYDLLKKEYSDVMDQPKSIRIISYNDDFEKGLAQKFAYYYLNDEKDK